MRNDFPRIVIGLGNPGPAYANTRHNAGFMTLDGMVDGRLGSGAAVFTRNAEENFRRFNLSNRIRVKNAPYVALEGEIGGNRFSLVKPVTFMNESGKAVTSLRTRGLIREPSDILAITDDVDLAIGRLRFREMGSAGGHNGLKSLIGALGTQEFARLRIGVGPRPPGHDMVDYVLGSFRPEEWELLEKALNVAVACIEAWLESGAEGVRRILSKAPQYSNTISSVGGDS